MHARAVIKCYRLWHHCRNHIVLFCNILNNILVTLHGISGINQAVKADVNLALACCGYFMVVSIAYNSKVICEHIHAFITILHESITGRTWKVTFLKSECIPYAVGRPRCLSGCDMVALTLIWRHGIDLKLIKDKKFYLWSPVRSFKALICKISFCSFCNTPRVAWKCFTFTSTT